jgi:pilus assembly protein CpaF
MSTYAVQRPELPASLAAVLADEVRVRVRDEGVDPQSQASAVRSIAESVVQAHDRRSLTGAVDPVDDLPGMVEEMVSRVSGFGALQRYLDDPSIEEVWINEPCRIR